MDEHWQPKGRSIEPGTVVCGCGKKMQVKAQRIRERHYPRGEVSGVMQEHAGNTSRIREWFSQFPYTEIWVLSYARPNCGSAMTDFTTRYSESEARQLAERSNAEATSSESEL